MTVVWQSCRFARSSSPISAAYSFVSSANMAVRMSMSPGISLTNIVKSNLNNKIKNNI